MPPLEQLQSQVDAIEKFVAKSPMPWATSLLHKGRNPLGELVGN